MDIKEFRIKIFKKLIETKHNDKQFHKGYETCLKNVLDITNEEINYLQNKLKTLKFILKRR